MDLIHDINKSARLHTFMEIDHELISTVIRLPSTEAVDHSCWLGT